MSPETNGPQLAAKPERISPPLSYPNGVLAINTTATSHALPTPITTPYAQISPTVPYALTPMTSMASMPLQQPTPHYAPVPLTMQQGYIDTGAPYDNTTSCAFAASVVRSVRPDVGPELEAQMCANYGGDCKVDNNVVFEIIDRYSQPGMI